MAAKKAETGLQLVHATLRMVARDGKWVPEFGSSSPYVDPRNGNFDFKKRDGEVLVLISLKDSPGFRFPANADLCIGFSKKACPKHSDEKDHDMFQNIAVSGDGQELAFLNRNKARSGTYWYALFVERGAESIPIDPKIINR